MKRFYVFLVVKLLLLNSTPAQYVTGAVRDTAFFKKDEAEKRNLGHAMSPPAESLPISVSLRAWCPTVGNQCSRPTCVAWAIGYAAMTIRLAYQEQITEPERIDALALSASYIFNKSSFECNGISFSKVEAVLKAGVCPAYCFPNTQICTKMPTNQDSSEATPFKVKVFQSILLPEYSIDDKLLYLKRTLNAHLPIVVQVRAVGSLFNPEKGVWKPTPKEPDVAQNDHALCLVGYDDKNRMFELMNSWDTTWGDKGFVRIGYDDLLENALQENGLLQAAYKLDLYPPVEAARFKAEMILERLIPTNSCANRPFERISIQKEDNVYKTVKLSFTRRDAMRLFFPRVLGRPYLYFFGQDAGTQLWESYADTLLQHAGTTLPAKGHLLNFTAGGTEILCCLFSDKPILDFKTRIQQLPKQKIMNSNLFGILQTQFPDITTALESDKMAFRKGKMALMTVVLEIKE
jgi:hypothetical protein